MYNFLIGKIVDKIHKDNICVVLVNGIGYEIVVSEKTFNEISLEEERKFFIVEISGGLYSSGLPTFYGFLSKEEKEIFLSFKDNLSNVGPKKALEYLDKVTKNIDQFKKAVVEKNYKILTSLFNFRQSSAEKIVNSLSSIKEFQEYSSTTSSVNIEVFSDIVSALVNLGYKEHNAKVAAETVLKKFPCDKKFSSEKISDLIKLALKEVSLTEK